MIAPTLQSGGGRLDPCTPQPALSYSQIDVALQVVQFALCSCTTHDKTRDSNAPGHTNKASHDKTGGDTQFEAKIAASCWPAPDVVRPLRKCCSCLPDVAPLCVCGCSCHQAHARAHTQAGPLGVPQRDTRNKKVRLASGGPHGYCWRRTPHAHTHARCCCCCWVRLLSGAAAAVQGPAAAAVLSVLAACRGRWLSR